MGFPDGGHLIIAGYPGENGPDFRARLNPLDHDVQIHHAACAVNCLADELDHVNLDDVLDAVAATARRQRDGTARVARRLDDE